MAFYSSLWCTLRDLGHSGNVEPRHSEEAQSCQGRIEVAHLGARAGWRRCSDEDTAPLCQKHHRDIDGRVGGRGRWYVELGREGQRELREKLVMFAGVYWDLQTDEQRAEWDRMATPARRRAA